MITNEAIIEKAKKIMKWYEVTNQNTNLTTGSQELQK